MLAITAHNNRTGHIAYRHYVLKNCRSTAVDLQTMEIWPPVATVHDYIACIVGNVHTSTKTQYHAVMDTYIKRLCRSNAIVDRKAIPATGTGYSSSTRRKIYM